MIKILLVRQLNIKINKIANFSAVQSAALTKAVCILDCRNVGGVVYFYIQLLHQQSFYQYILLS